VDWISAGRDGAIRFAIAPYALHKAGKPLPMEITPF
jgi:hypothetical protein